jgi:hypothetical protein
MAQGVYCTEYAERVSGHVGRVFVATSRAVHLTGVKHIQIVRFLYACERLGGLLRPPGRIALGESRAQAPGRS